MPLSLAKASVNVGVVSGGTASNVVAGEASCLVDLRYESLDELNRIRQAIRALSETVSIPGVQVEAVENFYCAPMVADEKSENMAKTLQEVAEAYQLPIGFVATGGSSDANNISEMGVPVLDGCGPCGGNLHSDAEFPPPLTSGSAPQWSRPWQKRPGHPASPESEDTEGAVSLLRQPLGDGADTVPGLSIKK